jgi:DNA-binding response OmpR family regulator
MARVLVVENDEATRWRVGRVLRKSGHEVLEVASGASALLALQESSFDVVITAISLPEIDGFEVTRAVRKWCDRTEVIAISDVDNPKTPLYLSAVRKIGATDTLIRPFLPEDLLVAVNAVLDAMRDAADEDRDLPNGGRS